MWSLGTTSRAFVALAAAALVAAAAPPAVAQTGNGAQQQQVQSQIAVLSQAQTAALARLQGIQAQKASLDARVADLTTQITGAEARIGPLAADAARLDASVAELRTRIAATQVRLSDARQILNTSAARLYRSARSGAEYATVLAAGPSDLAAQNKYLSHVTRQRQEMVRLVASLESQLQREHATMAADQARADAAARDAQRVRDQLVSARDQLAPAQAQAAEQAAAEQAALQQIQGSLSDDRVELATLQAASARVTAQLQASGISAAAGGVLPGPGKCQARPVPGAVTSPFGPRGGGFHPGVDMHALMGDPIHACLAGTVVSAGWNGGYGNAVVIDHGGGIATLYGHQSRLGVTAGQHVNAGDVIGSIGSTGFSTGPHLHFEVRINGKPINPAPYAP